MIEKRYASLETHRHAGAVDFCEDVIRKISHCIQVHHVAAKVRKAGPLVSVAKKSGGLVGTLQGYTRRFPHGEYCLIPQERVFGRQDPSQPMNFVAIRNWRATAEATRKMVPLLGAQAAQAPRCSLPDGMRQPPDSVPNLSPCEISFVTAKQLVAAIARQAHGYMPPGQGRYQVCGDLRGVGKRFI